MHRRLARTFTSLTSPRIKDYCAILGEEYYNYEKFELNPPTGHDDYELVRRVGKGKFSEVFLARDLVNDRDVVLKLLKRGKQCSFFA